MVKITVSWKLPVQSAALDSRIPHALRLIEREVLRSCEPYVPYRTGQLCRSGHPSGSGAVGSVTWSASHGAECYYATRSFGKKHHPHATARWFEAAKAVDLEKWRKTAADALTERSKTHE